MDKISLVVSNWKKGTALHLRSTGFGLTIKHQIKEYERKWHNNKINKFPVFRRIKKVKTIKDFNDDLTLASFPITYPKDKFQEDDVSVLENWVAESCQKCNVFSSIYIRSFIDNGMLITECKNNASKKIFKYAIRHWPERKLKTILRRSVPKFQFSAFVSGVESSRTYSILTKLPRQNKGLDTSRWKIRNEFNIDGGVNLCFVMDMISTQFVIDNELKLRYENRFIELNFVGKF